MRLRRAAWSAATALLTGVLSLGLLGGSGPVVLDRSEALLQGGLLVLLPGLLAGAAGAWLARSRLAALGYGLLPGLGLLVLANLVDVRDVGVHPDRDLPLRVLGGLVLFAAALRTRAAAFLAPALALGAGLALFRLGPSPPPGASQGEDRLVVLLTLDTTRGDAFSFNGEGEHAHAPNLEALAAASTVYREAHSPIGFTGPAHTSLMSGLQPWEHGVLSNGQRVPEDIPWLPSELQEAGWTTRAAVSTSVLDADMGFDRGFHAYDSSFSQRLGRSHPLLHFLGFRYLPGSAQERPGRETLQRVDLEPEGPTFVWLHLYDPHWPYRPSPEAAQRRGLDEVLELAEELRSERADLGPEQLQGREQYLAEIDDLDGIVGELRARLPEEAVLLVVADHGEAMGEERRWFTHGSDSSEAISHVPLAVYGPGWAPEVVDTAVSTTAVADTLRAVCGLPAGEGLRGQPGPVASVAMKSLQLIPTANSERFLAATVRYGEQRTSIDREGGISGSEEPALVALAQQIRGAAEASTAAPEPGTEEALRALGYLE